MKRFVVSMVSVAAAAALGSTLVPHTLQQRARASTRVAVARVVAQTVETLPDGRPSKTLTTVEVLSDVKGAGSKRLTVVQIGGVANGFHARVAGDAEFESGETCLVFLNCDQARCGLVALGEGKLPVRNGRVAVRDLFSGQVSARPLDAVVRELRSAP